MSERRDNEKEEEKRGEKDEKEEKSTEEKYRRDPLGTIVWAGILVWAGLVLLAENLGLFNRFEGLSAWNLIFIGAGLIVLLEVAARLLFPEYRRPVSGSVVFAVILLAVGLGGLGSWSLIWPLALIAGGIALLIGVFMRR